MVSLVMSLVMLLPLLLVFMSTNIVDHMVFAQPQLNSSTTNSIVDNVNLTQTPIEEAKDVYANSTEAAKQVVNKTREVVQAVANRTEEAVHRIVNTTEEAVNETSLFISNASQIVGDEDIRDSATQASKLIRTETEDRLRTLITETQDILDNLKESVRPFFGGG